MLKKYTNPSQISALLISLLLATVFTVGLQKAWAQGKEADVVPPKIIETTPKDGAKNVQVKEDMTLDIKLEGGAILSGQVTDSDGKPVANANITAYGPKTKQWVQTAADGTYRIALTPGTYTLRIAPPKESGLPLTTIENVQVKEDMTLDIKLEGGTILSGRVTDSDGKPVANASINASGPSHVYTKTATDGTYRMILSPGAYRLEIEPPEESGLLRKSIHDVQVTKDKKLDITLEKGVTLSGKVTASDGKPVARAFINARGAMPERYGHGQTADDGGYRITLTPAYPPFPKGG